MVEANEKERLRQPLLTSTTYPTKNEQQAQAKAWRENEFGAAAARSSPLDWSDQKKRPATRRRKGIIGCQTKWKCGGKHNPRNKEVPASGKKMRRSANGKSLVTRAADVRVYYLKVKSTARTRKMRTKAQLNRVKAKLQKAESELQNMKKLAKKKAKMQKTKMKANMKKLAQLVKKKGHAENEEEEEGPDAAREEEGQEGPDEEEAYFCMLVALGCSNALGFMTWLTDPRGFADKTTKQTCIDVHQICA